jgi:hypothetical protein
VWHTMALPFTINPKVHVMFILFQGLKPWFVRRLKAWNTCCYWYHTKLKKLLFGVNEMWIVGKGIHTNYTCRCGEVCNAQQIAIVTTNICTISSSIFFGLTTLWTSIVCPKFETSLWHARPCYLGECQNCGIDTLKST